MKYICIDDGAVTELISGRDYQSIDFERGDQLIQALQGKLSLAQKIANVIVLQDKDGVFLTTPGTWKEKRYLIVDCEQSSLFTQLKSSESLTAFQKLLRFCTKIWNVGSVLGKNEKVIGGSSKAILFPMPFSERDPFRIAIEREPMKERLAKRDMGSKFLLVYKSGTTGANSVSEVADETNFKKAFERLQDVYAEIQKLETQAKEANTEGQVNTTDLPDKLANRRSSHLPFSEWIPLLSKQQYRFIFAPWQTAHRLVGPAGTGKTLSLVLRTINVLNFAEFQKRECNALLITHSEATRTSICNELRSIDEKNYQDRDRSNSKVTLEVETLASLCAKVLRQSISDSEFVDRDAQDSKLLQGLYIERAIEWARQNELKSFRPHMSENFARFIDEQTDTNLVPLLQHEIAVMIKGRASDSLDAYLKCPPLKFGLPVYKEADKGFVFRIFEKYQEQLRQQSQFDTDDVVISAVGQLDTPIWRRRRTKEGFDFIAIDETHLFNMNELHIFHHFTKSVGEYPISFTFDAAQAVGDRGWNDVESFSDIFGADKDRADEKTDVSAVFRSSKEIVDFCHSILASGATLFTSFTNSLDASHSAFTALEDRRATKVEYVQYIDDREMVEAAFELAEDLRVKSDSKRSEILISSLSEDIIRALKQYADSSNKAISLLDRRGDYSQVRQAEKSGHMVLGHADFVGGLEFNVVVIVGVDKGRVPANSDSKSTYSRNYSSYVAHNRLYVAASRAKYSLRLLGVKSRGPSDLLLGAAAKGLIEGLES